MNRVCRKRDIILKYALDIPSYKQDIISVNCVTKRGVKSVFGPDGIITPNDTNFDIMEKGKLYFVNSVGCLTVRERTLDEWHEIMGYYNDKYVLKLKAVVNRMKNSNQIISKRSIFGKGKMSQFRK